MRIIFHNVENGTPCHFARYFKNLFNLLFCLRDSSYFPVFSIVKGPVTFPTYRTKSLNTRLVTHTFYYGHNFRNSQSAMLAYQKNVSLHFSGIQGPKVSVKPQYKDHPCDSAKWSYYSGGPNTEVIVHVKATFVNEKVTLIERWSLGQVSLCLEGKVL